MTFLKVLLIVLAVLWLISLIRVGGRVSYGQAGLFVTALVGPLKLQILPARPGKKRNPKKRSRPRRKSTGRSPRRGSPAPCPG